MRTARIASWTRFPNKDLPFVLSARRYVKRRSVGLGELADSRQLLGYQLRSDTIAPPP
jgi:hypothetical protein